MNRKFSTLLASALLVGGLSSHAYAENWATSKYVANSGKYHLLQQQNANWDGAGWSSVLGLSNYYLSVNASGEPIFTPDKDKDAYWTIVTRANSGRTEYQLKNLDGKVFVYTYDSNTGDEIKVEWFLSAYDDNAGGVELNTLYFYAEDNKPRWIVPGNQIPSSNDWAIVAKESQARGFDIEEIAEKVITAEELNAELTKNAFGLIIGSAKDKEYTGLQGNVFTGEIEAKAAATNGTYYFYRKADKKYIVLTENVWSENTANLDGKERSAYAGYKFEAISEHAFGTLTAAQRVAQAEFQVLKSYDFNDTDSLIVTLPKAKVGDMPANWAGDVSSANTNKDKGVRLYVSNVDNKNYLTVIEYAKANNRLATQDDDAYANYQVGASVPYIKLGASNIVDFAKTFAGKVWNITDKDGKVLSPNVNWANVDMFYEGFTPAAQVQLNKPEGHWLPYYTDAANYGFVNRESGIQWNLKNDWVIRTTATPNLYEVYTSKYWTSADQEYKVYITEAQNAELGKTENGYASFDEAKEALDGKYITLTNGVTSETVYVGKDADDNVILTTEKSEAIEFRIKDMKHDYTSHDGLAGIDTLQHITTYMGLDKDGEVVYDAQDTVQFYHYRLFETFSEKYLTYNNSLQKFELEVYSTTDNNAHEDFNKYLTEEGKTYSAFVLKEKNGKYNLVSNYDVKFDACTVSGSDHAPALNAEFDNDFNANLYGRMEEDNTLYPARKMYGAFQTATLANMSYIYNYNDNERFAIENVGAPEYMRITGAQDTIKVSLKAQPNFFLYEDGTFLGMEHVADADMKPAMFVDTAYVRNNTYRPQYLLAMNGKHVEPVWDNHPNSPDVPHLVHPDTTYGRFLINAVDSAAAWTGSKKTNPYIWESLNSTNYYRLVFVEGIHTGDVLTLYTNKGDKEIALGNNDDKVCAFAFRYVDEAREGVKIETTYDGKTRGWLKYQNNVPVVTNDYEDAHVFTVDNETIEAPTANDAISASKVSVVATNGAVIIKGAAGKTVAISNVLGQTIANTVLSSDDATIAAPAGVVVVAVEGEAAVKAIVK